MALSMKNVVEAEESNEYEVEKIMASRMINVSLTAANCCKFGKLFQSDMSCLDMSSQDRSRQGPADIGHVDILHKNTFNKVVFVVVFVVVLNSTKNKTHPF